MYSKDELLSKDISELADIAQQLDAEFKSDDTKENIIYSILDRQAVVEGTKNSASSTKRKRVRIVKKDTDRVYSVNGKEGENFDTKKNKVSSEPMPLFKDQLPTPVAEEPQETEPAAEKKATPAKRGRKSKAEKEALAAAAAAQEAAAAEQVAEEEKIAEDVAPESAVDAEQPETTPMPTEGIDPTPTAEAEPAEAVANEDVYTVPEATFTSDSQEDDNKNDLLAQLQAKVNAHNEANEDKRETPDGIWEGDPGDGTDFIPIVDLPIEDQGALPSYDIFDNPTTPVNSNQNTVQPVLNDNNSKI